MYYNMQFEIEKWIDKQEFPQGAISHFQEAIICYRISAYRAAFLFSYIAFMQIVKDRILNSSQPTSYQGSDWIQIQTNIQNPEMWEKQVLDVIKQSTNPQRSVFPITESLKDEVNYWKNKRNDCAHAKINTISFSVVEAFWDFLQQKVNHFVIVGSREDLINRIVLHFNPANTPPHSDNTHLIKEIQYSIKEFEYLDFFNELIIKLNRNSSNIIPFLSDIIVFYETRNIDIVNAVKTVIAENEKRLLKFIRQKPERIGEILQNDRRKIRLVWYNYLFVNENDYDIYCQMLRKGLINSNELIEANRGILSKSKYIPNREQLYVLKSNRFFDAIKTEIFVRDSFTNNTYFNNKRELIILYLENQELDLIIVKSLCEIIKSLPNTYKLYTSLHDLFRSNNELADKYFNIAMANNIELTDKVKSLINR